jgi:RNA polymerase sporulation-specific sigma factor
MPQSSAVSSDLSDEVLVRLFHEGDVEALDVLLERYRRLAGAKARGYFLAGGDYDDLQQEAMIGLFKAIRDFRYGQSSFRAFAELCVTRQIMTAIKGACRQKHQPLNRYVSLWGLRVIDDPSERLVEELFDQRVPDPADEVVSLEVDVLRLHLDGCSYQEISDRLGRHTKAVDNALQRIKRKLEAHLAAATVAQSVPAA